MIKLKVLTWRLYQTSWVGPVYSPVRTRNGGGSEMRKRCKDGCRGQRGEKRLHCVFEGGWRGHRNVNGDL